jgi:hypothetical protein
MDTSDKLVKRQQLKALRFFEKCADSIPKFKLVEGADILDKQGKDSVAWDQYLKSLDEFMKAGG